MISRRTEAGSGLRRMIDGRLAELRAMTFDRVMGLPPRTVCDVKMGRSELEVSETVRELPSGRLLVRIEVWRKSLWRKPRRARQVAVIYSSSGRIREASEDELDGMELEA